MKQQNPQIKVDGETFHKSDSLPVLERIAVALENTCDEWRKHNARQQGEVDFYHAELAAKAEKEAARKLDNVKADEDWEKHREQFDRDRESRIRCNEKQVELLEQIVDLLKGPKVSLNR